MIQGIFPASSPADTTPREGAGGSSAPAFGAVLARAAQDTTRGESVSADRREETRERRAREESSPVEARAFAAAVAPQPGMLTRLAAERTDLSSLSAQELASRGEPSEAPKPDGAVSGREGRAPAERREAGAGAVGGRGEEAESSAPRDDRGGRASADGQSEGPARDGAEKAGRSERSERGAGTASGVATTAAGQSAGQNSGATVVGRGLAAPARAEGVKPVAVLGVGAARRAEVRGVAGKPAQAPTMPVVRQAVQGLAAALSRKDGQVTLRLAPEQLGELKIQLKLKGANVEARIEATSEPAKKLLEQERGALRTALESHGLCVDRVEITLRPESEAVGGDAPRRESGSTPERHEPGEHAGRADVGEEEVIALAGVDRGVWTDLGLGGVVRVDMIA